MTDCPRCRDAVEMERRHCWTAGKHSVMLRCPECGHEVAEPRPEREVRVSANQRRLEI